MKLERTVRYLVSYGGAEILRGELDPELSVSIKNIISEILQGMTYHGSYK